MLIEDRKRTKYSFAEAPKSCEEASFISTKGSGLHTSVAGPSILPDSTTGRWRGPLHSLRRGPCCRKPKPEKVCWERHRRYGTGARDPGTPAPRGLSGGKPNTYSGHTGTFGRKPDSGEIVWTDETYRIFEYDVTLRPTLDAVVQRVHSQDRALTQQVIQRASQTGTDFEHEYRLLMDDGRVKHVHAISHAVRNASGDREFIGAVTDITERKTSEEDPAPDRSRHSGDFDRGRGRRMYHRR